MDKFILIVKLVTQLMPVLIDTIKRVEEALPQSGQGQAKLHMVRAFLETAFNGITDIHVKFDEVWPSINTMINSIVQVYNTLGTFKK